MKIDNMNVSLYAFQIVLYVKIQYTFATVQCCKDLVSHGSGLYSLRGTPDGMLPGTAYDIAAHTRTIRGTP